MTQLELRDKVFPHFERWIDMLIGQKGPRLPILKNRLVAAMVGAAYRLNVDAKALSEQQWTNIVEFVRRPQAVAQKYEVEWPVSKGRWDGKKGYRAQLEPASRILSKLIQ
jgi:hypothetical protein